MMNIYVGNLPSEISAGDLEALFIPFGRVQSIRLIKDRFIFGSGGFAFVNMPMKFNGLAAIKHLNGKEFFSRYLKVNEII
jgi:RNA recognition motif-containing protein